MFNPKPDIDLEPFAPTEANDQEATLPRAATSPLPPVAKSACLSVIGTDLTILGDRITIISQSKLQIDGDIRGNVSERVAGATGLSRWGGCSSV